MGGSVNTAFTGSTGFPASRPNRLGTSVGLAFGGGLPFISRTLIFLYIYSNWNLSYFACQS